MQTAMNPGSEITLSCSGRSEQFTIDSILGYGANCIVYNVHRLDNDGHCYYYRMKECFPYNAGITRVGTSLNWPDEGRQNAALKSFRETYNCQLSMQNDPSFGNQTAHVIDLYTGNRTLYSLMDVDYGDTFDNTGELTIDEIITAVYELSCVVAVYHAHDFLHLDLKPSNFLISFQPLHSIRLFDIDTVTRISELNNRAALTLSYSEGWSAPEQRQGQVHRLSPATDVYAIGAILFQKIMGRLPTGQDTHRFASWSFDSALFDGINPAIKRILADIFHNTITANPSRRYADAGKLSERLKEALEICRQKTFILTDCPVNTVDVVGRTREIDEIQAAFEKANIVVLHGFGGIGKSTIALEYAAKSKADYDAIVFLPYQGSIDESLASIEIQNFDNANEQLHRKELRRLLNRHILLIIDNCNVVLGEDPSFEQLLRLKAHVLITSRTYFSAVYNGSLVQIECKALPFDDLAIIFRSNYGLQVAEEDRDTLESIFKKTAFHTYATLLAAKQAAAAGWSLKDLDAQLAKGLRNLKKREKVKVLKDSRIVRSSAADALLALFTLADLDDVRKQVLRNLYLLGFLRITIDNYRAITHAGTEEIDALNELSEGGFVQQFVAAEKRYYALHPLMQSIVLEELKPTLENCEQIDWYAWQLTEKYGKYGDYSDENPIYAAEEAEATSFLCRLFARAGTDNDTLDTIFEWLKDYLATDNADLPHRANPDFRPLFDVFESCAEDVRLSLDMRLSLISFITLGWLAEYGIMYFETNPYLQNGESIRKANTGSSITKLLNLIEDKQCSPKDNELFCAIAEYLAENTQLFYNFYNDLPDNVITLIKLICDLFPDYSFRFNLTIKSLTKTLGTTPIEHSTAKDKTVRNKLSAEDHYRELFNLSEDKAKVVEAIINEANFSFEEKLKNVSSWVDEPFSRLSTKGRFGQQADAPDIEYLISCGSAAERFLQYCDENNRNELVESGNTAHHIRRLRQCSLITQVLTMPEENAVEAINSIFNLPGFYCFTHEMHSLWSNKSIILPLSYAVSDAAYICIACHTRLSLFLDMLASLVENTFKNVVVSDEERFVWYKELMYLASHAKEEYSPGEPGYNKYAAMESDYRIKTREFHLHFELIPDSGEPAFTS